MGKAKNSKGADSSEAARPTSSPKSGGAKRPLRRARKRPQPASKDGSSPVRASGDSFDRLIHEPLRLGIMSALAVRECLTFNELKAALVATDGNLSVHARRLEEAGYLVCKKSFKDQKPLTTYQLTAQGRASLHEYLNHMEALIQATRGGSND